MSKLNQKKSFLSKNKRQEKCLQGNWIKVIAQLLNRVATQCCLTSKF